ncbi:MAG: VanZ family protein [Sedimentisphaerales bacterium]|nr:VanZ family protein [Sedimentisphaerales bacterium]
MKIRLRYVFIATLLLYWPMVFVFTHISEVPRFILRTQMSDKTMHYLGYLVLVFLWWFSVFPSQKPSVRRLPFWITLAMMAAYGGFDEWLQGFTHRTPDVWDWVADMGGAVTGLIIFGVFGLRLSALGVTTVCIFILTSLCKTDPLGFVPFADILFYLCAYSLVTLLWMDYLRKRRTLSRVEFVLLSLLLPVPLLSVTLIVASIVGKQFAVDRLIAAGAGIVVTALITAAVQFFWKK